MDNEMKDGGACGGACGCGMRHRGHHGCGRGLKTLCVVLALLSLTVWLGFKARNEAKQYDLIGVPVERNTISVSGEGKVVGIPDIAAIDLGTTVEKPTVAAAQQENTRIMNNLDDYLKSVGVDPKDVQTTSYDVTPNYDWTNGVQKLRSYSVTQNVHVKVRDLSKVGAIIGQAGTLGANEIGGIQFTIDNPDALTAQARDMAIADAQAKAAEIGKTAHIRIVRIVSYDETNGGVVPPSPVTFGAMNLGMGGAPSAALAPAVETGSNDIVVDVTLTYEIQ
jgi:uncharacterized protein YggE